MTATFDNSSLKLRLIDYIIGLTDSKRLTEIEHFLMVEEEGEILTEEEYALLDERMEYMQKNPNSGRDVFEFLNELESRLNVTV